VLYGYMAAIARALDQGVSMAGADRLLVRNRTTIALPLPEAYDHRIARLPGVDAVSLYVWFGGIYQDPKNFFAQMAVWPEEMLRMYPEYRLSPEDREAWARTRDGAVVGRRTAERFGWKVGDRIPLQATIWRKKDDSSNWEFNLRGIYDADTPGTDTSQFFFHYTYFDESRLFGEGQIGWYYVRIADPSQAPQMAERIDALFANSPAETKTTTEKAFAQAFAKQVGDIGLIVRSILGAVFFTILLVAGNTMAQSVRERTSELAVLKTLGFTDRRLLVLVLAESCLIAVAGGLIGLGVAWLLISRGDPTGGALPGFFLPTRALAAGLAAVLGLGIVAGIFPAIRAMRLQIVDALRRV